MPAAPPYGSGTLSDLVPALLAALGREGFADPLGLPHASSAVLLLIDGLGWELLRDHGKDAPFLAGLLGSPPLHAGFPATTGTSLTSIGTGRPAGEHGIVGYCFDTAAGPLNCLTWRSREDDRDLRDELPPERVQPLRTAFERAADAGVRVLVTAPRYQDGSGLTRAAFRGAGFRRVGALGDLAAEVVDTPEGTLRYAYHGDLDALGHQYGPGSKAWRLQLAQVDRLVESAARALPASCLLVVTGDHGMISAGERIDVDTDTELQRGVRLVSGEPRVRHVYAQPDAAPAVLATWRDRLGDRAWVRSRDEAIDAGWFGPAVTPAAHARIGEVVAAMRGEAVLVRSAAEPLETGLRGHHGSLTDAEQLVPLLVVTGPGT